MAFLSKVLGNSAAHGDPMLSKAAESLTELEFNNMDFEGRAGQSWGDQVDEMLPTTEYVSIEEDPVDFTVTLDNTQLCVPSDNELSLAASGGFSEGDAEAGGEEDA